MAALIQEIGKRHGGDRRSGKFQVENSRLEKTDAIAAKRAGFGMSFPPAKSSTSSTTESPSWSL
jgi:hypothetical protein